MHFKSVSVLCLFCLVFEILLFSESKANINQIDTVELMAVIESNDKLGDITRDKIMELKGVGKVKILELEKDIKYTTNYMRKDVYVVALILNKIIFLFLMIYIIKQYFTNTRMIKTILEIFKKR